jgi:hypothetical protein
MANENSIKKTEQYKINFARWYRRILYNFRKQSVMLKLFYIFRYNKNKELDTKVDGRRQNRKKEKKGL